MKYFWYAAAGVLSGVLGGMGMGGGTLLIPLLGLFNKVPQHTAQAINLISFIPMAVVALIIHVKNGLVEFKYAIIAAVPAVIFGVMSAFAAKGVNGEALRRGFGCFLILLSGLQAFGGIKKSR